MRRLIPLCLLGFLSVALVPTADAATGRRESHAASSKSAKASVHARTAAARPAASAHGASRHPAASGAAARGGATLRDAKARPAQILRKGKAQRTAARVARRPAAGPRLTSWQAGLPAAEGEQRECPVGTMSTLARGHDDVVRCLPL